jgi:hypothetical protein
MVDCNTLNARAARTEDRARAGGTPDSLQDLSGAPPDSEAGPQVRAPTVGTQRPGDVAGTPDSVWWRTGLSGAPCDSSLHQTASLVVGVCWGLVLKCYELRTRQHKMLNINALRPLKHYLP